MIGELFRDRIAGLDCEIKLCNWRGSRSKILERGDSNDICLQLLGPLGSSLSLLKIRQTTACLNASGTVQVSNASLTWQSGFTLRRKAATFAQVTSANARKPSAMQGPSDVKREMGKLWCRRW